ncbi:hypothetical protein KCP74_25170 [Salmonella enterica subsp. enterica]|nr:hypothetical protein KCP74_25170 [Salmonella enterica subsp. enterica]
MAAGYAESQRLHRIYRLLKLNFRRKGAKQRPPVRNPPLASVPEALNQSAGLWSLRTFNVADDCNREALSIEIDLNLPASWRAGCPCTDRITATAVIRRCVWIRDRNLSSRRHGLNEQRNMQ